MSVWMHGRDETWVQNAWVHILGDTRLSWGSWNNLGQSGGGLEQEMFILS